MTLVPKAVVASVLPFSFYNKIYKFISFGHNFVCLILLVSRGYWPKRKALKLIDKIGEQTDTVQGDW